MMTVRPFHRLAAWMHRELERQGCTLVPVRKVLIWQAVTSFIALACGLLLWPISSWLFWAGTGLTLATWNFYGLSKFIMRLIPTGWSKKLLWGQVLRLHGRLLFTAVFVYVTFVWCSASPFAVLTGLVIAMLPVVFIGFISRTCKP